MLGVKYASGKNGIAPLRGGRTLVANDPGDGFVRTLGVFGHHFLFLKLRKLLEVLQVIPWRRMISLVCRFQLMHAFVQNRLSKTPLHDEVRAAQCWIRRHEGRPKLTNFTNFLSADEVTLARLYRKLTGHNCH